SSDLIITAAILVYARLKGKGTNLYEIVLYAGTNCRKVTGFCDTGNRLRDALTGKPVSVVKEGEMKMLLQGGDLTQFCPRYIPFCSLGCETGVLLALTLDSLTIKYGRESRTVRRPLVVMMKEGAAIKESCKIILNADLVNGQEEWIIMHAVLPNRIRFGMFPGFSRMIFKRPGEIFYIGGTDVLPAPLDAG